MIKRSVEFSGEIERDAGTRQMLNLERQEKIREIRNLESEKEKIFSDVLQSQEELGMTAEFDANHSVIVSRLQLLESRFKEITELTLEIHGRLEWISRELGE